MTDDPFLADVRADWHAQIADLDRIRAATERRRQRTVAALVLRIAATATGLFAGTWFIVMAAKGAPDIFALAGIVLLIAFPLMLLEVAGTARALRITDDDTPAGVLRRARDQAASARHRLWGAKAAALLLGASAICLAILTIAGRARPDEAMLIAPLWAVLALGMWVWQALRSKQLDAEIARSNALLAELRVNDLS